MQLKILSWNIWCGKYLDEVADFLRKADADIIALQEVLENPDGTNIAQTIAKELGYECVFNIGMEMPAHFLNNPALAGRETVRFGNAILSKHKIVADRSHELSLDEKRGVAEADIQIGENILRAFSIHLKHTHQTQMDVQDRQADRLAKMLTEKKTIVMGDFNSLSESYPIEKMKSIMNDTEPDSATPTWSVYKDGCTICQLDEVRHKLDYIFTSKDLKSSSFKVYDSKGSDHLPISAMIEI